MTKSRRGMTPRLAGTLIGSIAILLLATAPAFGTSNKTSHAVNPAAIAAHLRILYANANDVASDELDGDDQGDQAEDDQGENDNAQGDENGGDQGDQAEDDQGENDNAQGDENDGGDQSDNESDGGSDDGGD